MTLPSAGMPLEESPNLPLWKRVLFVAILFGLTILLLEFLAGAVLRRTHGYDGRNLLQYSFDPYKNIVPTPGYVDTRGVSHNSVGFRGSREFAIQKPEGTLRIFLMGASTAQGTGGLWPHIEPRYPVLPDSVTIDRFLERFLTTARPDLRVEVINAAIPSTWTHHSLIYLNQTILRYSPDIVLFLDGFNDFFFCESDHDQFARYAYGERASVIMGQPTFKALVHANGWWITRRSAAAYLAFRTFQQVGQALNRPGERPPVDVERCLAGVQRNFPRNALAMWRRSAAILRGEGVDGVFMLQPLLMLDGDRPGLTATERELYAFDVASWRSGHDEYVRRAVPWISDTARSTIERSGNMYLDLTELYAAETTQIFTDYAHLTPYGNELLARAVAESIMPIVARRRPAFR